MKMVISIGSNLQDPQVQVKRAINALRAAFEVRAVSSLYRTTPVGRIDQPEFCNAVVIIDDQRPAAKVLEYLHRIESEAGRVRDERWGPRVLDLDLIDVEGFSSDDPACLVPHPRAHERAFVLAPWAEIEPDAVLSGHGPISALLAGAQGQVRR